MNITDVGHLTSDGDDGEDKMLKGAKREKKTVWEVAEFYTKAFKDDLNKLNIIEPNVWCKATDHIKEQIEMIQTLENKGFTYSAGGNVYYDTSKFKKYGKFARLDLTAETKSRVEADKNKKNPHDFVLWFTKSKFDEQAMKWESPFGTGYPGWHIECSAMASKYLGERFDIHCGGIDHISVHHTNELAQSEAAFGKKWVQVWMHNEFLVLPKNEKMSKSSGNFLTLSSLEFDPLDYRYFCLGTQYRNPLMYSTKALEGARTARKRLFDRTLEIKESGGKCVPEYLNKFMEEINDDLNTAKCLATMWELLKSDVSNKDKYATLLHFDRVLGFNLGNLKVDEIPANVEKLAKDRLKARNDKDWAKADTLRDEIAKLGYDIMDTKELFEIKKL